MNDVRGLFRLLAGMVLVLAIGLCAVRCSHGEELVLSATEQALVDQCNAFRASCGLHPLVATANLMQRARGHSAWMARNNSMTHSGGIQENIAYGQRGPVEVTKVWIASSGHNVNMRTSAKEIGVGAVMAPGGAIYWTQQFATGSDRWGARVVQAAERVVAAPVRYVANHRRGLFRRRG